MNSGRNITHHLLRGAGKVGVGTVLSFPVLLLVSLQHLSSRAGMLVLLTVFEKENIHVLNLHLKLIVSIVFRTILFFSVQLIWPIA